MSQLDYDGYREWKDWSPDEFGLCDRATSVYYQTELTRCGFPKMQGCIVMEIGFGNGGFAAWASSQGARFMGVETIPELVSSARARGFDAYSSASALADVAAAESLDLVVAFDVFEHLSLEDLQTLLREIHDCLRNGGRLVARVPSGDSPFSRAIQHGDLTHRLTLGSSAIRQLAAATGFELVAVRAPVLPLWGLGLSSCLRRTLIAAVHALVFPLIINLFMGGGKPVLMPNLVFVLRKP